MDLAYWAVVILGAVTLVVESARQFTTPVDIHPFEQYPILRGIEINTLCTTGELLRGFLIYALLYIIAYAAILGSAEILDSVVYPERKTGEGEALSGMDHPVLEPLVVSATIITALSIGLFSPIENRVRALAQRIAGIPRGVYRVLRRLNSIDLGKVAKPHSTPLVDQFRSSVNSLLTEDSNPIVEETISEIQNTLYDIDILIQSVIGPSRDVVFTAFRPASLDRLIVRVEGDVESFRNDVQNFTLTENDLDKASEFYRRCTTMKNNLEALLSLLFIRNQGEVRMLTQRKLPENPGLRIVKALQLDRDKAFDALAGSLAIMLLLTAIYCIAVYWFTQDPDDWNKSADYYNQLVAAIRDHTIVTVVFFGLVFGCCTACAIMSRETSIEYGAWKDWNLTHIPFGRLLTHSIFPGIVVVFITILVKTMEYVLTEIPDPDISNPIQVFIRDNWKFCLMTFVIGVFISTTVLVLLDQHEKLSPVRTVLVGVLFLSAYMVCSVFIQLLDPYYDQLHLDRVAWRIREISIWIIPGLVFVISYALLLEAREKEESAH